MYPVALISSMCTDVYPDNHGGEFRNNLNRQLNFDGEWEVALKSIIYQPDAWNNVDKNSNTIEITIDNYMGVSENNLFTVYYNSKNIVELGGD